MTTKESLNREYERVCNWQSEFSSALTDYIEKSLEFLGGVAELKDYYKTIEEAEEHDMDFIDQFPISFGLFDKHNFMHDIFIVKVYRKYDVYYVDGFDNTDGKWVEGWFTDGSVDTKESLAYFIDFVLNP